MIFIKISLFVICFGTCLPLNIYRTRSDPLVYYKYDINTVVDTTLPILSALLKNIGMDPMYISSITDEVTINPVLSLNQTIAINLSRGNLSKLSIFKRFGNTSISFRDDMINFQTGVIHKDLSGRFYYHIYTFPIVQQGILNTTITNVTTTLNFVYDLKKMSLSLKSVQVEDIESVKIILDNKSIFDEPGTAIANMMAPIFKQKIMFFGQRMASTLIKTHINEINEELHKTVMSFKELYHSIPNLINLNSG